MQQWNVRTSTFMHHVTLAQSLNSVGSAVSSSDFILYIYLYAYILKLLFDLYNFT